MKIPNDLREVIEITNNLDNFVPFGVIFLTGWPALPASGIPSSSTDDSWKWIDFPFVEIPGISPLLDSLVFLVRRAYCRLSFKVFDKVPGLAVIRVYMMPNDSDESREVQLFREKYFKFKRPMAWLLKQATVCLQNLLTITDFNVQAFNLNSASELILYMTNNTIPIIKFYGDAPRLGSIDQNEFSHHLERLIHGKSFSLPQQSNETRNMQRRLNEVYLSIDSPSMNKNSAYNGGMADVYESIQNNEIPGFKSTLYNFQKRSILKMIERESLEEEVLMPHIIKLDNNVMFDITAMLPVKSPATYTPPRGGILAENMGLGKTCITLALICLTKFEISETPIDKNVSRGSNSHSTLLDYCVDTIAQNSIPWREYYDDFPSNIVQRLDQEVGYFEKWNVVENTRRTRKGWSGDASQIQKYFLASTTLVLLPDNLFHQWRIEIFKHLEKDYLKVLEIQTNEMFLKCQTIDMSYLLKHDVILISNSVFAKQFENSESFLKKVYWKRIVVDEGHSMNSKTSRVVLLTKELMYERMWVISGTPTSGLTHLHIDDTQQEYNVQKAFHPKEDLDKLGTMVANYFKLNPWASNRKLWTETITKPFERNDFNIEIQLKTFLSRIIVRHNTKDVEDDILLPKLHHKPVFLKPSFYDKLSINLFISVLATNAITSERNGSDFMFDPSNKVDLRRLVTNLQKGTFYWTSFSIKDIENLLNISVYSLREKGDTYTNDDKKILTKSIYNSKLALSNLRWRAVSTIHEMGYFAKNLPQVVVENYSLLGYSKDVSIYGYPHLTSVQKLFYKNRVIDSEDKLKLKISHDANIFWNGYWKSTKTSTRPLSNKDDIKDFKLGNVQQISKLPEWVRTFDPKFEEEVAYGRTSLHGNKKSRENSSDLDSVDALQMKNSELVGTLSQKLNYLTMRLLENQCNGIKSIVFYEFENSAYYLTELMDILGMNYLMYAPYIKLDGRSNNLAQFDSWDCSKNEGEGISLIMDLKLASHGLTIIAATHVFFINPVWNQATEAQAIKRAHRIGQINEVFVETLILEDTLEEQMYNMRKDTIDSNNVELIDHSSIRDYILTFPFLPIFIDGTFDEEYCKFETPFKEVKGSQVSSDDNFALNTVQSKVSTDGKTRKWKLPVFTKKNQDKLFSNNKISKRRYDDIELLKTKESQGEWDDYKRIKVMEKLRSKRHNKVRFSV